MRVLVKFVPITESRKRQLRAMELTIHDQERGVGYLLPGLPDELTCQCIVTRLDWATVSRISIVSRVWHRALRSRKIHYARERSGSCQTFIVVIHETRSSRRLDCRPDDEFAQSPLCVSLYDPSRDVWHLLPPVPGLAQGVPHECECACSSGQIYFVGGLDQETGEPSNQMYKLDLAAGRGVWTKCAAMNIARSRFSCCAVKEGLIYAFGGASGRDQALKEAEVYCIENDQWNPLPPMHHGHTDHKVAKFEDEFYVQGGLYWRENGCRSEYEHTDMDSEGLEQPLFAEVYNPNRKEWRKVQNFRRGMIGPVIEVNDKLAVLSMSINHNAVEVYVGHSNSWTSTQQIKWILSDSEQGEFKVGFKWPHFVLYQAVALDSEILAWLFSVKQTGKWDRNYLLKSKGLGIEGRILEWTKMPSASNFPEQVLCLQQILL